MTVCVNLISFGNKNLIKNMHGQLSSAEKRISKKVLIKKKTEKHTEAIKLPAMSSTISVYVLLAMSRNSFMLDLTAQHF